MHFNLNFSSLTANDSSHIRIFIFKMQTYSKQPSFTHIPVEYLLTGVLINSLTLKNQLFLNFDLFLFLSFLKLNLLSKYFVDLLIARENQH